MVELSHFFTGSCFKVLNLINDVKESISFKEIRERLSLSEDDNQSIYLAVSFLKKFGQPISISYKLGESEPWLIFESKQKEIKMSLNLYEWLFIQKSLLESTDEDQLSFGKKMISEVNQTQRLRSLEDLFTEEKRKSHFSKQVATDQNDLSQTLNRCVEKHLACQISMIDGKIFDIFPHRVVFLEGDLTIIGEDYNDRCLVHFTIGEIKSCEPRTELNYETNFSTIEVEDFIQAVRSINENEERLILKLKSPEKVDFNPDFLYLGNPYVTTNMDGDFIWAASVEVSYELFEWLDSIEGLIEVLDPQGIKDDYQRYLEAKQKVNNDFMKKAS